MAREPFRSVGAVSPIRRTAFDLSHDHKTTINMGKLYPVMCIEVVPSDIITLFNEIVLRFQPLIAPILHQVDVYTHTFFVPYRLLWGSQQERESLPNVTSPPKAWENFISGGKENAFNVPLPRWTPVAGQNYEKTLWDYFSYPMEDNGTVPAGMITDNFTPEDFPRRAYNFIFNEYYRDQDLYPMNNALTPPQNIVSWDNIQILNRCWEKDYFTIARPTRQRGQSLGIPLSGFANLGSHPVGQPLNTSTFFPVAATAISGATNINAYLQKYPNSMTWDNTPNGLYANMSEGIGTFDTSDLRNIIQLQKWQERNMRAGVRYRELIPSHFGIHIGDERIDRPEYLGGTRSPVIVSEVLQTEGTTDVSPQANMAGHGLTADTTKVTKYTVREFGLIMTLLSVRPRTAYNAKQLNRQWLRRTRYDFYWPEFAHLSEQGVYQGEVRTGASNNWSVWGFQGVYDELRYIPSMATGDMRKLISYWHLARDIAPNTPLNWDFVKCQPRNDIFAVQSAPNADGTMVPVDNLILNYSSRIKMVRPLPFIAEPGLVDHF